MRVIVPPRELTKGQDTDAEEEKQELAELTEKFQPLLDYLKKEAADSVMDGQYPPFLVLN